MKTMRRDTVLRLAKAGKLVLAESYHFDDQMGESRNTQPIPVAVREEGNLNDYKPGVCQLSEHDFKSGVGRAWRNDNGTICLYVHSNCNYTFKVV